MGMIHGPGRRPLNGRPVSQAWMLPSARALGLGHGHSPPQMLRRCGWLSTTLEWADDIKAPYHR